MMLKVRSFMETPFLPDTEFQPGLVLKNNKARYSAGLVESSYLGGASRCYELQTQGLVDVYF